MPTKSIYSRSDSDVAWQSCRHDQASEHVEDIEIKGSHLGMGWNPAVLQVVASTLAHVKRA